MGSEYSVWLRRLGGRRIPLGVKLAYTAFLAVLVPVYLSRYGVLNFLWFCDVALLVTFAALWVESAFLASVAAVAIVLPQGLWAVDFLVRLLTGAHVVDMTEYMFNPELSLFTRGLSLFHGWLPFLLLWMVWRLGYDRRALGVQVVACWLDLLLCFVLIHDPQGPAGNVNKILGWNDDAPQTWTRPVLWLGLLMAAYPVCLYLPAHFLLRRAMPRPADRPQELV